MRVTRSKSAGLLVRSIDTQAPSRVAKAREKNAQSQNVAVESAQLARISTENSINQSSSAAASDALLSKLPKMPASSAKVSSETNIELAFSHFKTTQTLELPADFVAYHTPEFVEGIKHVLKIDPSLYPAIAFGNFEAFSKEKEELERLEQDLIKHYWYSLISSVISQQVSGSAAKAIKKRFRALFPGLPTPKATLSIPQDTLKAVGLLNMKLKYVIHISEVFSDPESNLTSLDFYKRTSTQDLVSELTKLKGIGEWSASMFAIFTLKELDIFAYDDLGVARGVARYLQARPHLVEEVKAGVHAVEHLKARLKRKSKFHLDKSKRGWTPLHDEYVKFLAQKFEPCRTAFMLVMWRLSSTNIEALEKTEK